MRDLARTLEIGYWGIGILLGAGVASLAPEIAARWIDAHALARHDVTSAVVMMGALVALQWPLSFYEGGLMGLQRQVLVNTVKVLYATFSYGGALVLIWALPPDIVLFFEWQTAVAIVHLIVMTVLFWTSLPHAGRAARFETRVVRDNVRFAAGMSGITLFGLILVQMDKVVLSKLLTLQAFGYYILAGTVVNGLQLFSQPAFAALFPRLSSLVAANDEQQVKRLYHAATQMLTVLIVPAAAVLMLFPFEIVNLWIADARTAQQVAPLVQVLAMGTAINGLMHLPYGLQLAYGWTSIGVRLTIAKVLVFLPLLIVLAARFGAIGAAAVWTLLNATHVAVGVPLTHRRLLKGDAGRWLLADVGIPTLAAFAAVFAARCVLAGSPTRVLTLLELGAGLLIGLLAAICVAPRVRSAVHYAVLRPRAS